MTEDRGQVGLSVAEYPSPHRFGVVSAPFHYWRRTLDSCTQTMTIVDKHIGAVVDAPPSDVAANRSIFQSVRTSAVKC